MNRICSKSTVWLCVALLSAGARAQMVNPIQAAKDAYKKAQQQKQQQQGQPPTAPGQGQRQGQKQNGGPAAAQDGPFTPPPGTKIDTTLLAPMEQGALFSVSPRGVHMGTLSHSGSRFTVVYDGAPGPKFDQIFQQTSPSGIVFSPDGNHYAYCGLQGNDAVVMADGKEIYRDFHTNMQGSGSINFNSCQQMSFTSNSKHLYFLSQRQCQPALDGFSVVWDGKPDTVNSNGDLRTVGFSPDGDHVAYLWMGCGRDTTQKLLIDGKPAPYVAGSPQWSADSQHLYTVASRPQSTFELLEDGKPVVRGSSVRLFVPPVGNMAVASVTRPAAGGSVSSLVIGGKFVPGSESTSPGVSCNINSFAFSADGKHYAIACSTANGRTYVFADGKKTQDYSRLDMFYAYGTHGLQKTIGFTSPSGTPVFVGNSGGAQFVVVGSQESNQMNQVGEVAIAPTGNHVVAAALHTMAFDGKMLPMPQADRIFSLVFSPDGLHLAYGVQERNGIVVYLDGNKLSGFTGFEVTQSDGHNQTQSLVHFSPDSKHLAYFCRLADPAAGNNQGVCLDGKYLPIAYPGILGNLTFSPDSNHLFWNMWSAVKFRAYVDGRPVVESSMPSTGGFDKVAFQEDPNNNLLILVQDQDGFKRISVTPAADSSLASMGR